MVFIGEDRGLCGSSLAGTVNLCIKSFDNVLILLNHLMLDSDVHGIKVVESKNCFNISFGYNLPTFWTMQTSKDPTVTYATSTTTANSDIEYVSLNIDNILSDLPESIRKTIK